jgi:hypothetical protein
MTAQSPTAFQDAVLHQGTGSTLTQKQQLATPLEQILAPAQCAIPVLTLPGALKTVEAPPGKWIGASLLDGAQRNGRRRQSGCRR